MPCSRRVPERQLAHLVPKIPKSDIEVPHSNITELRVRRYGRVFRYAYRLAEYLLANPRGGPHVDTSGPALCLQDAGEEPGDDLYGARHAGPGNRRDNVD